jgi:hypothetical protein
MFCRIRTHLRASLVVFLGFVLGSTALHAQLDPRLWKNAKTDFLDLFQQSTSTVMKPEIVTVFDFSGSMAALMYHPGYYTASPLNSGAGSNAVVFTLGPISNTYTLKATSAYNTNATAQADLTVNGGSANFSNSGAQGGTRITTLSNLTVNPVSGYTPGSTVSISVTVTIRNTGGARNVQTGVTWSGGGAFSSETPNSTVSLAGGATRSWVNTVTWTVPPLKTSPITGSFPSNPSYTLLNLIKPDGSAVTNADAAAAVVASGQNGAAAGAADVRNWIRAASHARFTNGTRTVDIPIPWKSLDKTSTGNPLSSAYAADPVGGTNVELDRCYAINGGNSVLDNNAATSSLRITSYDATYVDWMFNGKYQNTDSTRPDYSTNYSGQYVIFDAATPNLAGGQGNNLAWGQGFGTYFASDSLALTASKSVAVSRWILPARTRVQAVKEAAVRTWLKYQKRVVWAYRMLDTSSEGGGGTGTTFNNDSKNYYASSTAPVPGTDSGWTLLNGNSPNGLVKLSERFVSASTPITYAMARGLAQFSDPASVFNSVYDPVNNPVPQCLQHFMIFFTDGLDNNGTNNDNTNRETPYIVTGTTAGSANGGNATLIANPTNLDRNGSWWNLFTFAGAAAHLCDIGLANHWSTPASNYPPTGANTPDKFLPLAVNARDGITFKKDHAITTMTVGVSLGGQKTDPNSSKYSLFVAAATGDPNRLDWDLSALTEFTLKDPGDPTKGKTDNSTYFFDATDPDLLVQSLDQAFFQATLQSNVNATTNPNIPYIGASFGKQVYLGKFQPPANGGAVWPGDLLMFATKEVDDPLTTAVDYQTVLLDKTGNITSTLDHTTAQWSAWQALLNNRNWSNRKLYTRTPGSLAVPDPGWTFFSDVDSLAAPNNNAYSKLKSVVGSGILAPAPAPTDADKKLWIQFAAGANTDGAKDTSTPPRPATNRTTIMGDVINSSPAAIEFKYSDVSGSLPQKLLDVGGNRFRLILVGTNQGWLHAFGEVTKVSTVVDNNGVTQEVVSGAVDELWSFMPTDFLPWLDHLKSVTNPHRFMVDGTPTIYHLDLPPSAGGSGNGVVDSTERAIAVFGLRKGGRSYYALDIHDPFNPVLKWSLVPDEAAALPASRVVTGGPTLGTVQAILANMGYSTAAPALGRVSFNSVLRDVVFLGGGMSVPEIEANFTGSPKLGRSVMALDVYTGEVLAAVDLGTTIGPIGSGLVPFEFFLNSGLAQRAYFLDYKGGLWAWGSGQTSNTGSSDPFLDWRIDNSDLARWTTDGNAGSAASIRKVAQDSSGVNAMYSTLPAPFRVGYFPGVAKTAGTPNFSPPPPAVGVAIVSGDRNNPLDYYYTTLPSNHRVTVVFDRQDSKAWGLDTLGIRDTNLINFTSQNSATAAAILPGSSSYYLAPSSGTPYFGYYVNFPSASGGFVPKGVNEPMIVAGSLFYSYFNPQSADPCAGGSGESTSLLICDVINPIVKDTRTDVACISGSKFVWTGVASNYMAFGTRGVIQGGVIPTGATPPPAGVSATKLQLQTILGKQQERFPKARVWRTIR